MWQLVENRATLSVGPLCAQLDLARPDGGLFAIQLGDAVWPDASLLCIRLPSSDPQRHVQPVEAYVRGPDLVATYPALPPFTIQPQIYWRLREDAATSACGVELILSVQTSKLYSEPQTPVSSQFAGVSSVTAWQHGGKAQTFPVAHRPRTLLASEGAEGLVALAPAVGDQVYVEMIHPSDFHALSIEATPAGKTTIAAQIFQEHLEKGVIRRARLCSWFLPTAGWQDRAWKLFAAYAAEPPPLTA